MRITYFSDKTLEEFKKSTIKKIHDRIQHECHDGMIAVLINKEKLELVGVAILSGKMVEHDLLDVDTYSGTDSVYNRYEVGIRHLRMLMHPLSLKDVSLLCGVPADYKKQTNISKNFHAWCKPFITVSETVNTAAATTIVARYTTLIKSLL